MAFNLSTHGASSPTVFEQQREELVREIAVVSIHLPHLFGVLLLTNHRAWNKCSRTLTG